MRLFKRRKRSKIGLLLDALVSIHRHDINGAFWLDHLKIEKSIRDDMDILSRRIANAFEYVTAIMAVHLAQSHSKKVGQKKPAKKGKK